MHCKMRWTGLSLLFGRLCAWVSYLYGGWTPTFVLEQFGLMINHNDHDDDDDDDDAGVATSFSGHLHQPAMISNFQRARAEELKRFLCKLL